MLVYSNKSKVTDALFSLDYARALSRNWVLAYSGGKDSTVLLDIVFRYWVENRDVSLVVVHNEVMLDPPVLYKWVYSVLPRVAQHGVEVYVVVPRNDYITLMLGRGYSAPGSRFMWCTTEMKGTPTHKFMKELTNGERYVKLTGVRMDESEHRARAVKTRSGDFCPGCGFLQRSRYGTIDVAPIVDWSTEDVINYLRTHEQPWGGGDYSYLLDRVYCGLPSIRNGCWVCTLVTHDDMLEAYSKCFNDPRYLRIAELKRRLRLISLDWGLRLYKSKKFNEEGLRKARELLTEMFTIMPELLRPWLTFKPHVIEEYLPHLVPLMKNQEPLDTKGLRIVIY